MLYYRLYFMSKRTGHIMRFAEYEAPDDAAAMDLAREQEGSDPLELWCRHRKVGRFEPPDPACQIAAGWQPAGGRFAYASGAAA